MSEEIQNGRAVEALLTILKGSDSTIRRIAALVLERIDGDRGVEGLVEALKSEDDDVCQRAASALGEIGDKRTVKALAAAMEGRSSSVRVYAVLALGRIGDGSAAEKAMLDALLDNAEPVRLFAAEGLGEIGGRQAVAFLLRALKDQMVSVGRNAARSLWRIGDKNAEALASGLMDALAHEEAFVRRKAAQVVGYYATDKNALRELSRLATTDPVDEVKNAASEAVEKYRRKLQYFSKEVRP